MHARYLIAAVGVLAANLLNAGPAAAQSREWQPPRTPDGKPDLQGTFTFRTITPLQRPGALAGKDKLTPEEAAAFETSENIRLNRDLYDPAWDFWADFPLPLADVRRKYAIAA